MSDEFKSPFVPGARVAIMSHYRDETKEAFVEKVYKNGNFILKDGGRQQYHPTCSKWSGVIEWRAVPTGGGYVRDKLQIWDEHTDQQIREAIAETKRKQRLRDVRLRVERLRIGEVSDEMLDAIEAVLPAKGAAQ